MIQDYNTFETFEEILEHLNRANAEFQSSIDFVLLSEGAFNHIMTLMHGMTAAVRLIRIEINKQHLRRKGDI